MTILFAVESEGWPDGLEPVAGAAVFEALRQSGAKVTGVAELSIVLVDDAEQQALNKEWRGIDKPTNVLSFPQIEPFGPVAGILGDIVLARETLEREALADQAVFEALAQSGAKVTGVAELSILLVDDAEQQRLNQEWRGIDKPTNVLSFPQVEPFGPVAGLLGDIVLARETLEREAAELETPFAHHFTHLVVHGFLHILGYDHLEDAEAAEMEGLETRILATLGVPDPYQEG